MVKGGACVVCTASHCAGGMHPTGMHSYFFICIHYFCNASSHKDIGSSSKKLCNAFF